MPCDNKPASTPGFDLPTYSFPSAQDMEAFMEREYSTCPGFHLKLAQKSSGFASVSSAEAVEVALCFGWIDGRANAYDQDWWLVRYTPRRSKSIWSRRNVNTVQELVENDRMRPAGMAAVEAAKEDDRWDCAYDGPASITVPEDLISTMETDISAQTFFTKLNKSRRYAVLHRIQTAPPTRRVARINALVAM